MKRYIFSLMLLTSNIVFSQYLSKDFTFEDTKRSEGKQLSLSFGGNDTTIFLENKNKIQGFYISGNVHLEDTPRSYARITIEDEFQNEYLVYEIYPLISKNKSEFQKVGIETACLDNVLPIRMKIEVMHASILVDSIYYLMDSNGEMKLKLPHYRRLQCEYIANTINTNLNKNYGTWCAGVTDIAKLSYEDKKTLFGGKVPILYGIDYYKQGVFVMTDSQSEKENKLSLPTSTNFVSEWDWRDRHGKNWMSPIKNQSSCGSCWAFSPIGTFESYVNLYYNQLLNYDLSEQEVLSCSGAGNCADGGYINDAYNHIKSSGAILESCFPYLATDAPCSTECVNPNDRLFFEQFQSVARNEGSIKTALFKSPISFGISSWNHFLVLVGYKQIQGGENYFTSGRSYTITLSSDDPLVGQTALLLKNSWGPSWGDNGYGYVAMSLSDAYGIYKITGSVLSNNDIICEDSDNDGYYFWGIGSKPNNCPMCCPDVPDGNDSDPTIGELDVYGNPITYAFPYPTITISTDTIWTTNQIQCGNIIVTNNATLTIATQLTMNPAAKLIVHNGGTLLVNGGEIINANIEVQNSAKLSLQNNGKLHLKHYGNLNIHLGAEANMECGKVLIE
jgi:hypothetical protein